MKACGLVLVDQNSNYRRWGRLASLTAQTDAAAVVQDQKPDAQRSSKVAQPGLRRIGTMVARGRLTA